MSAARGHWRKALSTVRKYSSKHGSEKGPVYELRTYSVQPGKFAQFMDVMVKKFDIRLRYSQPMGYWNTEVGGLFQVVHIWEYESLGERAKIRQSLAKDHQWQSEFLPDFLSSTSRLENEILVLSPGTSLCTDFQPSDSAVYALRSLPLPTTFAVLSDEEQLVARFSGLFTNSYQEYLLLRYPDFDSAFIHFKRRKDSGGVDYGTSRLMTPCPWSPLK
ncbi:protein NipSnap homolog 3A-like [Pomacea canaliculata]|uniref:protein NipSnap homolog 3A-like n=1 Tax=Pomacea canaliculata TaxID=400727 RepID=UPI000D72EB4D|nr:protein NipSnap homolog 3A-like [Pomacea canaliculata]